MTGEIPDSDDFQILLNHNRPGAALRVLRESKGIDLDEITRQSLIPKRKLEDLEQDHYQELGGATFVNGYLRKYAKLLDVDSDAFVDSLPTEMVAITTPSVSSGEQPQYLESRLQRKNRLLAGINSIPGPAAVVFLLFVWGAVVYFMGGEQALEPESEPVAAQQQVSQELEPEELTPEVDNQTAKEALVTHQNPAPVASTEPSKASLEVPESPSNTAPETEPQATSSQDLLFVTFLEDCWIKVTDAQGEVLFAQLKTKGDNLQLFGEAPFEVMLGNARAAEILINGNPVAINPIPNRNTLRFTVTP